MNWEESQLNRYQQVIERNVDNLLRVASTEYNFLEIRPKVEKVIDSVATLKDNYEFWEQLPQENRDMINTKIDQIVAIFDQMENFDPKQNSAWNSRNNLIQQFDAQYREFYSYLIEKLSAFLGQRAFTRELTSEFGQQANADLKDIKKAKREIEKIRKDIFDASSIAGEAASTAISTYFDEQANEHKHSAKRWLYGVIASSVIAIILAVVVTLDYLFQVKVISDVLNNTTLSAINFIVLGFSFIAIRFTTKNYSVHQHLYVTNKHRSNALKSMEAFRTSAIDETSKDTILLAAVSAAYSFADTGFINSSKNNSDDTALQEMMSLIRRELK